MPPAIDQGTIIIIDTGRNTATPDGKDEKSFFQKARECAICVIERKIISLAKSHIGIILFGTKNTNNNLAEECPKLYKHIEVLSELATPSWQMIRDMPENPSNKTGDWFDALVVAVDHFKRQSLKFSAKKMIVISNFQTPTAASPKNFKQMLEGCKEENFEVDVIGPDLYDDNVKGNDIELARKLVDATNGASANFQYAMIYLSFHRKRVINAMSWNVDLKIGPNSSIPVSAFIRLKDEPVLKKWNVAVKNQQTGKASTTEGVMKTRLYMDSEKGNIEDIEKIKGYHYGQSVIPLSDADKSMLYVSGDKCLSVYGFTHKTNISWQSLNGDSLSYIFGRRGDKKAQHAIRCLVECMLQLDVVAIVRRVYYNNSAPKMFALFPVIDTDNYICLSMTAVCFKEDIKYMSFPSTNSKKYACTDEQVNAFKDLIRSMDLTMAYDETYDDSEAFPIARTVSPFAQFVLDCIAFRAMNPDKPLPPPREEILNLFKVPPEVAERSQKHLEKIKSLFVLNKVEKKLSKKKSNIADDPPIDNSGQVPYGADVDMSRVNLLSQESNIVDNEEIGTLDAIKDFTQLKNNGKTLANLAPGMAKAIEDLMYCNFDGNYKKAFDVMMFFRKECNSEDPSHYNNWLKTFKLELNHLKKSKVLSLIKERNVDFIIKAENNMSMYEVEYTQDDSQMYKNDTIPNDHSLTISAEINDLFEDF